MSAEDILEKYSKKQDWTTYIMLEVLLEYIDRQQSNEAFEDFLIQQADEENGNA